MTLSKEECVQLLKISALTREIGMAKCCKRHIDLVGMCNHRHMSSSLNKQREILMIIQSTTYNFHIWRRYHCVLENTHTHTCHCFHLSPHVTYFPQSYLGSSYKFNLFSGDLFVYITGRQIHTIHISLVYRRTTWQVPEKLSKDKQFRWLIWVHCLIHTFFE